MAIKIGFAGDFCPQGRIEEHYNNDTWKPLFHEVRKIFLQNDLNIVDLECPLIATDKGIPIRKTGPHLKGFENSVNILDYLNIALVATANNHFMDYGEEGRLSTIKALNSHNIDSVGSGKGNTEASKVFYKTIQDIKIAVINIAENEWSTTHSNQPGVNPVDPVRVYYQLMEARENADFVFVIAHAGNEHYNLPSPRIQELFRFFVDNGASAVISHHTHTLSGYEVYNGAPIFYSLGNFCFDWPGLLRQPWNIGMLLNLFLEKNNEIKFNHVLIRQNDEAPGLSLLTGTDLIASEKLLTSLNKVILDSELLSDKFEQYCENLSDVYDTWLQPYTGKLAPGLYKKGVLPSLLSKRKRALYTNIIRCEAHRDVLLHTLTKEKQ